MEQMLYFTLIKSVLGFTKSCKINDIYFELPNFTRNIITYIFFGALVVTQQFFMRESNIEGSLETQFIVSGIIALIILILDIILIMLSNNLTTKWRRASERSQIKSGKLVKRE